MLARYGSIDMARATPTSSWPLGADRGYGCRYSNLDQELELVWYLDSKYLQEKTNTDAGLAIRGWRKEV